MFEPVLKKSPKIVTKHFTITLNLPAPRSTWRVKLQLGKLPNVVPESYAIRILIISRLIRRMKRLFGAADISKGTI